MAYKMCAVVLALCLSCAGLWCTSDAYASDDIDSTISSLQQQIEQSAADYESATQHIAELDAQIQENTAKIEELENQIPDMQDERNDALVSLYKSQRNSASLIDCLLSAESFGDFLNEVAYLLRVQSEQLASINSMKSLEAQLEQARAQLETDKQAALDAQTAAESALADAQAAREQAQKEAAERAEQERAAAAAAVEAASVSTATYADIQVATQGEEAQAVVETSIETASYADTTVTAELPSSDGVDWGSSDRDSFVASWGARIDAYLSGSPLEGYGKTFAAAAWDYGVDPRWSPAISCVESSKGAYCFKSHNAWGWGSSSWSTWEEAINAHVAGLASVYGYTISVEAAQMYCPPSWEDWYASVSSEMNSI